ncbi:MAG TPA: 4'-phosphopantetheinyl transferase superfamily protein [Gemmatimonadaceae bacterium]|nr:4'-phosphopantetheinyl transferase superfamily protein [Gemmatimonadaceae bacterium]
MGAAGKPMLANTALHFNMSRSEDVALIAVSERGAVGVDVERLRPMPDATDLARAYFAGPAREAIAAASLDARDKVFLMQWTRLEAIVKADGGGLGASPSIVDVPFSDDDKMVRMRNREWGLQSFVPVDGYVAAFASDGGRESFGFLDAV